MVGVKSIMNVWDIGIPHFSVFELVDQADELNDMMKAR